MAKLIPAIDNCYSSTNLSERKVAEALIHHLNDDCLIWANPRIPPNNLEADFIVLDPGKGLIVIEVKGWNLSTIGQASSNSVTLITSNGSTQANNPHKQATGYLYEVIDRLKTQRNLVYPQDHSRQGKLVFPHIAEVIFTNISRDELRQKELEEVFGSRSVLCCDEIGNSIDSETFEKRLWSPLPFSLQTRLTPEQIASICQSLCLEKPLILNKPIIPIHKPTKPDVPTPANNKSLSDRLEEDELRDEILASRQQDTNPNVPTPLQDNLPSDRPNPIEDALFVPPIVNPQRILTPPIPTKKELPIWAIGSGLFIILGLGITLIPYLLHPKLQASSLTIGTLGSPEYQADLAEHLKEQLVPNNLWQFLQGDKIKIVIDGDKTLPYQEAERRIASKEWDIAFTLSPVISVAAKDNGYTFAARMFPSSKTYQSALFVKADSSIKSIDDIKPTTTIALGATNSASSFYMPSYDLYGKRATLDIGHRGSEILKLVKTGKADVGSAALGDTIKATDANIRIIHQSRDIPSSGIYLSSKLSESDRQTLKKLLLNAPKDIQKKANYGSGTEPDYTFFREIISKAQSIQICSDLTKNPVNLFCADSYKPVTVTGKINGWSNKSSDRVLNLRESSGKIYRLTISPQILNEAIGNSEPIGIQGKEVQVKTATMPQRLADGSFEVKIRQARQLKVLATAIATTNNQAL